MKSTNLKEAVREIEVEVLTSLILDQFNHNDIEYYRYVVTDDGYDLMKKVVGEEEVYIDTYINVPEEITEIAKDIASGKILKAVRLCKKYNISLNISKLMNNKFIMVKREYVAGMKLRHVFKVS